MKLLKISLIGLRSIVQRDILFTGTFWPAFLHFQGRLPQLFGRFVVVYASYINLVGLRRYRGAIIVVFSGEASGVESVVVFRRFEFREKRLDLWQRGDIVSSSFKSSDL